MAKPLTFIRPTPLLQYAILAGFLRTQAINSNIIIHRPFPIPLFFKFLIKISFFPSSSASNMSLSILVIAIPGILTTTLFLLIYYVFVIKCCLNWRSSLPLFRRHDLASSSAAESTGLDAAAIGSIPTFRYSSLPFTAECAVCLSEFRSGERLRLLPSCAHAFHIDCIDAWLQGRTSCPLCRCQITNSADRAEIRSVVFEGSGRRAVSMGDECIELVRRDKDEIFVGVQVLRRSLSLDSSSDGGGGGGGRRSFFSFGNGRNFRSAVQPVDIDVIL